MYEKNRENIDIFVALNMHVWFFFFTPSVPLENRSCKKKKEKEKHILMYRNFNKERNIEFEEKAILR